MKLKILIDLQTNHTGGYIMDVEMERTPSPLFWWSIPVGILLTFIGIPLFWAPVLYFTTDPSGDLQKVVDSFIGRMTAPPVLEEQPHEEVYEALVIESYSDRAHDEVPEGKVYMETSLRKTLTMSLLLMVVGVLFLTMGMIARIEAPSANLLAVIGGLFCMAGGAFGTIYVLIKMGRDH